eukprot:TRINITY_DN4448_c0_g1_i3.p1 TRINITY_DN4448_c0_g1~~TRINITY_DN4448_c0_g1_i3.p1  ORF type:complete len:227 (-),score=56.36 TRINITY_DN4448_c0_g1_i3:1158-1781(-)
MWLLEKCKVTRRPNVKKESVTPQTAAQRWDQTIDKDCPRTGHKYLIIGAGFLGTRIIKSLLRRGERDIQVFDYDTNSPWKSHPSITFLQGNITSLAALNSACQGIHTVFYTAATIRFHEEYDYQLGKSYPINVTGAMNVVQACQQNGVQRLIYTSTSLVCVPRDNKNVQLDEESPYVTRTTASSNYAYTKSLGELVVLGAMRARRMA